MRLRSATLAVVAAALAVPCSASEPVPTEVIELATDKSDRMTVSVGIAGTGPYPFVVDTGAERTVISRELAARLGLAKGRTAVMHSMTEVSSVETVIIPSLQLSSRSVTGIHAPALARVHLGAAGMLGVDSLKSQRVVLDFKAETMTVSPATRREPKWEGDVIVVTARRRFGQLILADASIDGEKVYVIVDTGAEISVGNKALWRKLSRRQLTAKPQPIEMRSVTGGTVIADYTQIDRVQIGGIEMRNLPVAFAEVQPFRKFGLTRRPALLLGMDALRLFDRVSIDFANKKVRFLLPDGAAIEAETRLASR